MNEERITVSIILPVHNADQWLNECLTSVLEQDFTGKMELSIYNDASTDKSQELIDSFSSSINDKGIKLTLSSASGTAKGAGYAKNVAVGQSSGEYLCFLDADDVMMPSRIKRQYELCIPMDNYIVGCKFHRIPQDSTPRYTQWANDLTPSQLHLQIYTAFGPTVVMPTWFCHRKVFEEVGGFSKAGKGTPEDLLFFYQHLKLGGKLLRLDDDLLMYRYHTSSETFCVSEKTLWDIRIKEIEQNVLSKWKRFTIWNAGKQGRKFYRSLLPENKLKVVAFCDVDINKIHKGVYVYEESREFPKPLVPIVHFSAAKPPFILCVKIAMTAGAFEENLASLNLREGVHYFHFS